MTFAFRSSTPPSQPRDRRHGQGVEHLGSEPGPRGQMIFPGRICLFVMCFNNQMKLRRPHSPRPGARGIGGGEIKSSTLCFPPVQRLSKAVDGGLEQSLGVAGRLNDGRRNGIIAGPGRRTRFGPLSWLDAAATTTWALQQPELCLKVNERGGFWCCLSYDTIHSKVRVSLGAASTYLCLGITSASYGI